MRFQCSECQGIVEIEKNDLNSEVQCGHCYNVVQTPSTRLSPGMLVADFIIVRELGRGGMGIVYLVHQMSLDRPAALKILADSYANDAEFVVDFIKEARAAAKLNHPHIVQAYAVGEDDSVYYFAMENIDGETMKQALTRERVIPVEQAIIITQQIAEALDYAWKEQKLIHRDIKPDNIMITSSGRAKLADLGLSRRAGDLEDTSGDSEVMGTPQYISPEQLTGAAMDCRSDIYSLGATLYHLITGYFPFEGDSPSEIAKKHLEEPLTPPRQINPQIPDAVNQMICKMMAKNVRNRYQDAESLVDDLRMIRRGRSPMNTGNSFKIQHGSMTKRTLVLKKNGANSTDLTMNKTALLNKLSSATQTLTGVITGVMNDNMAHTGTLFDYSNSSSGGSNALGSVDCFATNERRGHYIFYLIIIALLIVAISVVMFKLIQTDNQNNGINNRNQIIPKNATTEKNVVENEHLSNKELISRIDEIKKFKKDNAFNKEGYESKIYQLLADNLSPYNSFDKKALDELLKDYVPSDEKNRIEHKRKLVKKIYDQRHKR